MTPERYIILLVVVTLFAVLAVAQRARVIELGYRIQRLQDKRILLGDAHRRLLCEISALSHPARIVEAIHRAGVPLMDPVELTRTSARDPSSGEFRTRRTAHR